MSTPIKLPIPETLYSCAHCASEYSWPARDLYWDKRGQKWVCTNCYDTEVMGPKGTSLESEIAWHSLPSLPPLARFSYLAAPYSHPDPAVRETRFKTISRIAAWLISEDYWVFSPITHSHPVAISEVPLPTLWSFWRSFDLPFVEACGTMTVLDLWGWKESIGVQAEIRHAERMGKEIRLMDSDKLTYRILQTAVR
jgi:hypothetical protein